MQRVCLWSMSGASRHPYIILVQAPVEYPQRKHLCSSLQHKVPAKNLVGNASYYLRDV